jgi:hypothetical protein
VGERLTSPYKKSEGIPVITEIMENETYVSRIHPNQEQISSCISARESRKANNDAVECLRQSSDEAKKPRKH